jgi:hypothetical protein
MATNRTAPAAKNEATSSAVPFTFDGVEYTIAPSMSWDLDALEAFENDRIAACVRLILGTDQWAAFRAKPRTVGDLNALFEAMQKAAGVEGN